MSDTPDLDVPEVEHSNLNPFDPERDPAQEEARLLRAVDSRRERLLEVRGPRRDDGSRAPEHERAQLLYEEASEQLRACRGFWRGIGEYLGTRGAVSVVNNVVDRGELERALADLPETHRRTLAERLGLTDEGDPRG